MEAIGATIPVNRVAAEEKMKFGRIISDCCPQYAGRFDERIYQKVQNTLARLRAETQQLAINADWSRHLQKQAFDEQVIDVSEVGNSRRHGKMNPDKFKSLAQDERAEWIAFNDQLLIVARRIVKDTEDAVQTLHAIKEILTLVLEPIEEFYSPVAARVKISTLREKYFQMARSIKSDGRIRARYLRILNSSHNKKLFDTWNAQLQKELERSNKHHGLLDEFDSAARHLVEHVIKDLKAPDTHDAAKKRRHEISLVKSKRDVLKNREKVNREQAMSWENRAKTAAQENREEFAREAERRRATFETCAHLYAECLEHLDKLHKHMHDELQRYDDLMKASSAPVH